MQEATPAYVILSDGENGQHVEGVAFNWELAVVRACELIRGAVADRRKATLTDFDRHHLNRIELALGSTAPSGAIKLWAEYSESGLDEPIWIEDSEFVDSLPPVTITVRSGVVDSVDDVGELNPVHIRDYDCELGRVLEACEVASVEVPEDDIENVSADDLDKLGYGNDNVGLYSISKHGGR